jgi:hypothetical protein
VQNPTQALQSVKDPGNTFELNPKWDFSIYRSCIKTSIKDSNTTKCNQIWAQNNPLIFNFNYQSSFLDLYLEFDDSGQISTKIHDKRDDFNFKIINFPNMCSNIPASPAYGVYISQLIRYAMVSSNYSDFLKRHLHLRNRLLDQGYKNIRLIRSLKKFIFRYQDLVEIFRLCRKDYKRWIFI